MLDSLHESLRPWIGQKYAFPAYTTGTLTWSIGTTLLTPSVEIAIIAAIPSGLLALCALGSLVWKVTGEPGKAVRIAEAMAKRNAELEAQLLEEREIRRSENDRHKQQLKQLDEKIEAMHITHRNAEAKLKAELVANRVQGNVNADRLDRLEQTSGEMPTPNDGFNL